MAREVTVGLKYTKQYINNCVYIGIETMLQGNIRIIRLTRYTYIYIYNGRLA